MLNVTATDKYPLKYIPVKTYATSLVLPEGKIMIDHLSFFQIWIAPESNGNDILLLIFVLLYGLIIFVWLFKLNIQRIFIPDISKAIQLLGYGILVAYCILYLRDSYYNKLIMLRSNYEFSLRSGHNTFVFALAASGIFIYLSKAYKVANQLQKDQAFTI
jgi:membrane-associated phospholipid phosphatase